VERVFDKKTMFLLTWLTLPLLFLPKINILSFGRETAGIRIDDLILLIFAVVCFWGNLTVRKSFSDIEKCVAYITGLALVSFIINRVLNVADILNVQSSLFYALRLLEYFSFFYIGKMAVRFYSTNTIILLFFLWNALLMVLQKIQLIGIFTSDGYQPITSDRILGIASFGSEIGLLLNMLFCYFIYMSRAKNAENLAEMEARGARQVNAPYLLLLLFVLLVVFSGARTAIATLLITFFACLRDIIDWRKPKTLILPTCTILVGVALTVIALYSFSGIVTRSKGLLSFKNIELISTVWDNIILDYDPIGRESVSLGAHDASWWMRIHKWCYALKLYVQHPECWILGIGPGFAMAALDGGFLRIFTELGIVGSFFYAKFFYSIASLSRQLAWMTIVFMLNMIFFDAHLAYKPMTLLLLIAGATMQSQAK